MSLRQIKLSLNRNWVNKVDDEANRDSNGSDLSFGTSNHIFQKGFWVGSILENWLNIFIFSYLNFPIHLFLQKDIEKLLAA